MDLGDLFKQAKAAQAKAAEMQNELAAIEIEGVSGGGMVRLALNGKGELKRIAIDPELLKPEDRTVLEDLILAAHNDAKSRLERRVAEEMQKLAGSLGLPRGMLG